MKPLRIILALAVIVAIIAAIVFLSKGEKPAESGDLTATAKEAPMAVHIHASGELQARRSEQIKGPEGLRSVGLYQVTIANLVPEGTVVEKGEFIASLDKTELDSKIKESQTEIDKITTQLDQARIDTAIEMRSLRDQLVNVKFGMKEKELTLELSKYEPAAIRQQASLDLERAQRELDQLDAKLLLTKDKSIARIQEINASYRQQELKLNRLVELQQQMTVTAPKSGMVIYVRDWNGKRGPGSQVSAWDPTIAELPDLTEMITKAYINEVDISKVMPGQRAVVTVDAFPGKEFPGIVTTKANIGEQIRNFDTKVFEVIVLLEEQDSLLRPAMTTGISILTDSIPKCIQIPLEALQVDSVSYVFKKSGAGFTKQEILPGPSNDTHISVALGLEAGDVVSMNIPGNADKLEMHYLDPAGKQVKKEEMEREQAARMKIQQEIAKTIQADEAKNENSGGMFIVF